MLLKALRRVTRVSRGFGAVVARSQSSVPSIADVDQSFERINVGLFRNLAFEPATPLCMKAVQGGQGIESLSAINKWFHPIGGDAALPPQLTAASYLDDHYMTLLPFELLYPQRHATGEEVVRQFIEDLRSHGSDKSSKSAMAMAMGDHLLKQISHCAPIGTQQSEQDQQLLRFHAPLGLLLAALDYNHRTGQDPTKDGYSNSQRSLRHLYIAQAPITDLPDALRNDLPAGDIVKFAGRGDIYDSSIWLGLEPTYTPLHRDPNPNLFVQLCSTKIVRLLPPASGDQCFYQVQQRLGRNSGNSRIRGADMMQGLERKAFYEAIWETRQNQSGSCGEDMYELPVQEAILGPGDAIYIPKGWWHSVKSVYSDGRLNGSVNWWFR